MALYVSIPTEVDAEEFFTLANPPRGVRQSEINPDKYYVVTIHQQRVEVVLGDYIIMEPDGIHFYPCKAEIFKKRYRLKQSLVNK